MGHTYICKVAGIPSTKLLTSGLPLVRRVGICARNDLDIRTGSRLCTQTFCTLRLVGDAFTTYARQTVDVPRPHVFTPALPNTENTLYHFRRVL
jgi:hypothetical protein